MYKSKAAAVSEDLSQIQDHVSKLTDRDTGVRRSATVGLWGLAINDENAITIARAGAIPPSVRLLSDSDTEIRRNAAGALWYLSVNPAHYALTL